MDNFECEDLFEPCPHRIGFAGGYLRNDGMGPPVIVSIGRDEDPTVYILTNQTIYVKCLTCFEEARSIGSPRSRPTPLMPPLTQLQ